MTIDTKRLASDPGYWDGLGIPKDAQEYGPSNGYFYKKENGVWFYWNSIHNKPWYECGSGEPLTGYRIPRPQKPEVEWDGEGLPPVGCEIEYVIGDQRYPVTVVGHYDDEVVVFQHEGAPDYVGVQPGYLKPQRTKEQRQREKLERWLNQYMAYDLVDEVAADLIAEGWVKNV